MKLLQKTGIRFQFFHSNTSGVGLIEIMIAIGLGAVMVVAFTNMIDQSNKATIALEEKVSLLQFEKDLITATAGVNLCEKAFTDNPSNFSFAVASFPPAINSPVVLPGIYLDATGSMQFAVPDQKLASSGKIKIDQIQIRNIRGTLPNLLADLTITLKDATMARRPIVSTVSIAAVDNGTNVTLTGCQVRAAGTGGSPAPADSEATCLALGGFWTDPGSPRPAFCSFDSDSMSWF